MTKLDAIVADALKSMPALAQTMAKSEQAKKEPVQSSVRSRRALEPVHDKEKDYLSGLLATSEKLWTAAAGEISFSPPVVYLGETPILKKGTINVIQGKFGVHKSRLAETFCSLLLSRPGCTTDFLDFERQKLTHFAVAYIDTERSITEEFPFTIQQITERAGYPKTERLDNFFPTSIKAVDRKERLAAVKAWIEYVRKQMPTHTLFAVLDVVTDCVASFNQDGETLALFDYIGNLCDDNGATFLLLIHENFGTEKARGHTGTEAANKANTVMQISFEKDGSGNDTDLVKLRFLKIRSAGRPKPLYFQFSQAARGLVKADPDLVQEVIGERKKKADPELMRETIQEFFEQALLHQRHEISQQDLFGRLAYHFECSKNTISNRVQEIVSSGNGMINPDGRPARLVVDQQKGRATVYRLEIVPDHDPPAGDPEEDEYIDPTEEPGFWDNNDYQDD